MNKRARESIQCNLIDFFRTKLDVIEYVNKMNEINYLKYLFLNKNQYVFFEDIKRVNIDNKNHFNLVMCKKDKNYEKLTSTIYTNECLSDVDKKLLELLRQ